jgi:hypothetical protein
MRTARTRLRELCSVVTGVYGPNNRADSMDRLCQDLQEQVSRDYPGQDVHDLYV